MKRISVILCAVLFIGTTIFAIPAKKNKTPNAVVEEFMKKFPEAKNVVWEKEKSEYEASFVLAGVKTSANFTAEGEWKETERTISVSDLPKEVKDGIQSTYPNATIIDAAKIETPEKGIQYEADIKSAKKKIEVLFDAEGKEVKK